MAVPSLLGELLAAVGPSGHEGPAAAIWRRAAGEFAEVTSDTLGTSFARVRAAEGAPTLAIVGHIDEIGIQVTHIGDDGMLAFNILGGYDPEMMAGQRVLFAGKERTVVGVVGRRQRSQDERGDKSALKHADLHADIGATRAKTPKLVRQ